MKSSLTIGTRGSALALAQAIETEALLREKFPMMRQIRAVIKTTGDRRTDVSLAEVAKVEGIFDKGVFIKELEIALENASIDLAVHSLKDVPTVLDAQFSLAAVLERAPIRDVLVQRVAGDLPEGARVGTSSVRRAKQMKWLRPDVEILDLRGNVPTRLEKLANAEYDAILLAEAGLVRLGYLPREQAQEIEKISCAENEKVAQLSAFRLPEDAFFPAAGQGAIGFEIRANDDASREIAQALNHRETWLRVTAEREFLRLLDAGCHTPVGVYSKIHDNELELHARVFPEHGDGAPAIGSVSGLPDQALELARELFDSLQ